MENLCGKDKEMREEKASWKKKKTIELLNCPCHNISRDY